MDLIKGVGFALIAVFILYLAISINQPAASTSYNPPGRTINDQWVSGFISNVSFERGTAYAFCNALNDFAKIRFNTMISNYELSHYGYQSDINKHLGLNTAHYAEEVFWPAGTYPKDYAYFVRNVHPLHWQELSDTGFKYYGYYIASGPAVSVNASCNSPEILGPDTNITLFLLQEGCTPTLTNDTWLVIELSNKCPVVFGGQSAQ